MYVHFTSFLTVIKPRSQDGDETVIYNSMLALMKLQSLYGVFPRIVAKGDYASVRKRNSIRTRANLTASD